MRRGKIRRDEERRDEEKGIEGWVEGWIEACREGDRDICVMKSPSKVQMRAHSPDETKLFH